MPVFIGANFYLFCFVGLTFLNTLSLKAELGPKLTQNLRRTFLCFIIFVLAKRFCYFHHVSILITSFLRQDTAKSMKNHLSIKVAVKIFLNNLSAWIYLQLETKLSCSMRLEMAMDQNWLILDKQQKIAIFHEFFLFVIRPTRHISSKLASVIW